MDTAIGINNSGLLVFSYNLEDTDLQQGGEFIFNGQDSVMWTNLRDAFGDQIKEMYQSLRSSGALSYDVVENAFEEHQEKWSEAIFNEDAFFKYIEPLTNPDAGKQPDASYLPMAQGSKAEQRKWWLYNRFRYMDSKFNAGDALQDYIMMRAYAVAPQVLTPYADIYLTTAWDGELTQVRATRGQTYTLPCPKDTANDAVVAIYSASQLASVGDLSGLKIKSGNFSMATRIQSLKVGDSDPNYSNTNLTDLQLGNNTLLSVLDVRNCPNLAITVDISGCSNIEEVYFDGTSVAGVTLPNGGILRVLHLPDTVTNLTVLNQPSLTDFVLNDASNLSTLRIERCGGINAMTLLEDLAAQSRVRLIGVNWQVATTAELDAIYDILDTMRGLDEQGGNMPKAQISGTVNVQYYVGNPATMQERYPNLSITYDELETYTVTFMAADGTTVLQTVTDVVYGTEAVYTGETPTKTNYRFVGWNPSVESVTEDLTVYPLFVYAGSIARQLLTGDAGADTIESDVTGMVRPYALHNTSGITTVILPNVTALDQRAFNGVATIETLSLPSVQDIGAYAFGYLNKLTELYLPSLGSGALTNEFYVFQDCTRLVTLDLGHVSGSITGASLQGCSSLVSLILRGSSVLSLGNVNVFNSTKYATSGSGGAYVYVPSSLISSYQSATNWTTLYAAHSDMFRALEDYTVDGTVDGELDESKI